TTRILGVISLLIGTTGLHDAVDWSVNRIWGATATRPFWLAKLRGLAVIVWVIVFAVSSLWLTWLSAVLISAAHAPGLVVAGILTVLPSFVLDVAIFGALYKLTPTCHVDVRSALVGAGFAAVLWELTKVGFGWWVLQVGTYNRVYGPLAASVIVMLWLWMTAVVFLFGAELAAANQRRRSTVQTTE
ncbi:MAG: YihY/virulence factor BrkB family protein, partial [Chloroflexi bacterium]|nr:YihY/virulence factor BrkB family protein [Chloroflexota bacterium]